MSERRLTFVSFEPSDSQFVAYLAMEDALSGRRDPQTVVVRAGRRYTRSVREMRHIVEQMGRLRANRERLPARTMWRLGDAVFRLVDDLGRLSLEIDDVYGHLTRDLQVKRKWLEKAIIFRRYLPDPNAIPESLNWGQCEKGTRQKAERLRHGLPLDELS